MSLQKAKKKIKVLKLFTSKLSPLIDHNNKTKVSYMSLQ